MMHPPPFQWRTITSANSGSINYCPKLKINFSLFLWLYFMDVACINIIWVPCICIECMFNTNFIQYNASDFHSVWQASVTFKWNIFGISWTLLEHYFVCHFLYYCGEEQKRKTIVFIAVGRNIHAASIVWIITNQVLKDFQNYDMSIN